MDDRPQGWFDLIKSIAEFVLQFDPEETLRIARQDLIDDIGRVGRVAAQGAEVVGQAAGVMLVEQVVDEHGRPERSELCTDPCVEDAIGFCVNSGLPSRSKLTSL